MNRKYTHLLVVGVSCCCLHLQSAISSGFISALYTLGGASAPPLCVSYRPTCTCIYRPYKLSFDESLEHPGVGGGFGDDGCENSGVANLAPLTDAEFKNMVQFEIGYVLKSSRSIIKYRTCNLYTYARIYAINAFHCSF